MPQAAPNISSQGLKHHHGEVSANQRKNRNLYTSIGNYNTSGTAKIAGGTVAVNASHANKSILMGEHSIQNANHSSLVVLNQSMSNGS